MNGTSGFQEVRSSISRSPQGIGSRTSNGLNSGTVHDTVFMSPSAGQGLSGVVRTGLAAHQIDQTNQINQTNPVLLSLRQIVPAGFLTQAFAVDRSASCRS
jgi:hypothetical protein